MTTKALAGHFTETTGLALTSALVAAADDLHQDIADLRLAGEDERFIDVAYRTIANERLPERVASRYSVATLEQFLDCLHSVASRLASDGSVVCDSLAEELALRTLLLEAHLTLELGMFASTEQQLREAHASLNWIAELSFQDNDFYYLFDPAFDGIESDQKTQDDLGVINLSFERWFVPFLNELPFLEEADLG